MDAGEVKVRITSDTLGVQKGFDQTVASLKRLEAQMYKSQQAITNAIGKSTSASITALNNMSVVNNTTQKKIQTEITKTNKFTKDLSIRFNQLYRTMFNIKTIGLVMFGGMIKGISNVAAETQRMQASLDTMTGGFGEETFDALSSFAARTNISTAQAVKQYTQLRAVGLQPTIQDMETILDLTNAFGGGQEIFQRISKAFGDIAAKGKLMGEEVRQLTNVGVPIRQILLDAGLLSESMVDQIAKANISATNTMTAVAEWVDNNFKGITDKIMKTWAGTVERLSDSWWRWQRVIGEAGMIDALQDAINRVNDGNDLWLATLEAIGKTLGDIVTLISSSEGGLAVIFTIVKAFQALANILINIVDILHQIGESFGTLMGSAVTGGSSIGSSFSKLFSGDFTGAIKEYQNFNKVSKTLRTEEESAWKQTITKIQKQWEGFSTATPTDNAKSIIGVSKEQEEFLNSLNEGIRSNPVKMAEDFAKQLNAAYQESIPKSEKLTKNLDAMKTSYESFFVNGGYENVVASMQDGINKQTEEGLRQSLEAKLELFKEDMEKAKSLAPTIFSNKEKEIQAEINKQFSSQNELFGRIDTLYNKHADKQLSIQHSSVAQAQALKQQLITLQQMGAPAAVLDEYMSKTDAVINKLNQGGFQGAIDGLDEMAHKMGETYTLWKDFATGVTDELTNAFTEFFDKGETDWGSFLSTIRTMIMETLVQQTIMGPLSEAMSYALQGIGGYFSGGGVTSTGGILSSTGGTTTNGITTMFPKANGGWINEPVVGYGTRSGASYSFAERGSEYVSSTASSANQSGGANVTVNIYGGGEDAQVSQRESAGGTDIDVMLDKKMAKMISSNGTATSKAMKASYGLRPRRQ